jgi:PKD repeat protein
MKSKNSVILTFLLTCSFGVSAQVKNLGKPKSWLLKTDQTEVSAITMPNFDASIYKSQDSINDLEKNGPWRFGHKFHVNYDLNNSGVWTNLPNGDRIWRFKVKSRNALSINFIFENLFIPQGATIYLYKGDKSSYLGAYTEINNSPERILGTDLVMGESAVIEYYEPAQVIGQGSLTISSIVHGYRDISLHDQNQVKALNDSGDCNRDIKCLTDPEPLWENEANAVAMIVVNGDGACTGTLVNNTAQDGRAYFLTANHCLSNPASWAFRFKWISPTPDCATTGNSPGMANPTQFQTLNGATTRSRNAGSDFALVEITNLTLSLAQQWGLYYAGWDNTGSAVTGAIGIHHPSGDIMKYAKENNALNLSTYSGAQTWEIPNWDEGVTEPGSSGSGLFDLNHRLIGQLFGGGAACNGTGDNNQPDYYGRLNISWNGNSAATRLKDWLDPSNSGATILDGYNPNQVSVNLDASIQSISSPASFYCGTGDISPEFTFANRGLDALTSAEIEYSYDGGATQVYSWTGNLATNQTESISLPTTTLGGGNHTITITVISTNGTADENAANNSFDKDFTINASGFFVNLLLTLDCYGSETTWNVKNDNNQIVVQGGPYADDLGGQVQTEALCLNEACYTFTIDDSFGDGLNGAVVNQCGIDGNYEIVYNGNTLTSMTNVAFGDQEINNFCVNQSITAGFTTNQTTICSGSAITYTSTSTGAITAHEWTFPGGTPATSTETNPVIFYNAAGTYNVSLTVSDGSGIATQNSNALVTVNASPNILFIQPVPVCSTLAPFTINVALPSGGTYGGNGVSNNQFNASTAGIGTTDITYTVTGANSCVSTETTQMIVESCANLSENVIEAKIFPNPITNEVNILKNGSFIMKLTDSKGKLINETSASEMLNVNTENLGVGIYFISIETEISKSTYKVVKN